MTSNEKIEFDPDCGISEEEQREIFTQINGIAEKNRQSLSGEGTDEAATSFKAKKSGGFFPILVNAVAVAALAGGVLVLSGFQGKTDAMVREGTKVYNSAERALIEEIRKETSSRLEAKENEIVQIIAKLEGIDSELKTLYSDNSELSADQRGTEARLRSLQEEYRSALTLLQDERSRILEEARLREASLQSQLESRTRELAIVAERSAAAIDIARSEMENLSREQAQAATVEAQIGALFATLNSRIVEGQLDEAAETVRVMRSFLNTPAFQSLRAIQSRKELYAQTINSFESMIEAARRNPSVQPVAVSAAPVDNNNSNDEQLLADLQARNTRLEVELAEKNRTLDAFTSQGSGMAQRVSELEGSLTTLRTMNATLESNSAERNNRIQTLERENTALNQTVTARNSTITQRESVLANRDECITKIQDVIQGRTIASMTIGELSESLSRIQDALQSLQ
ncbi:MAG: hypothetical protein LBI06_06320 [Treponema sp.]|jgi:VIT1/CCC1 family predicted Fe2+/Mn2+ transporter|nr:hypothetical protein [Treponema sp.]